MPPKSYHFLGWHKCTSLLPRYDHQERLTALEAMEHAYFFPVIKEHSRSLPMDKSRNASMMHLNETFTVGCLHLEVHQLSQLDSRAVRDRPPQHSLRVKTLPI